MTTIGADEPALLNRAKQGDGAAFLQLIEPHHGALRPMVHRIIDEASLLDDTMQDVYIKAFKGLNKFDGRSAFGTWLFRIAYNTAVDAGRRKRKVVPITDEAAESYVQDEDLDSRHDLAEALRQLSPEARAAVWLVDAQGFDYESAAEILHIPRGTLASRLSAARNTLRTTLGDYMKEADR